MPKISANVSHPWLCPPFCRNVSKKFTLEIVKKARALSETQRHARNLWHDPHFKTEDTFNYKTNNVHIEFIVQKGSFLLFYFESEHNSQPIFRSGSLDLSLVSAHAQGNKMGLARGPFSVFLGVHENVHDWLNCNTPESYRCSSLDKIGDWRCTLIQ